MHCLQDQPLRAAFTLHSILLLKVATKVFLSCYEDRNISSFSTLHLSDTKEEGLGESCSASSCLIFTFLLGFFLSQACGNLKRVFLTGNFVPSLSILSSTPGKCISVTMGRTEVLMYLHLPGPFLLWLIPGHLPASLAPVFFPRFPCFLEWWLWDGSSGRSRKTLISSFQLDQGSRFLMGLHCNHKSCLYETQKGKGNFTVTRCSPTTDNFCS